MFGSLYPEERRERIVSGAVSLLREGVSRLPVRSSVAESALVTGVKCWKCLALSQTVLGSDLTSALAMCVSSGKSFPLSGL